jgi:predicted metal-binding protein
MREVEPAWRCAVVVCGNERSADHPRGSCGAERAQSLRAWLRDRARQHGLKHELVVHRGGCMDVCGEGTTVAVHGEGGRQVFVVLPGDEAALWARVSESVTPTGVRGDRHVDLDHG